MLDFLKNYGISQKTIEELIDRYNDNLIYCVQSNELEIEKIINYFNNIGIKDISSILTEKIYIFTKTFREVKTTFEKYNIKELASFVNSDTIDIIFEH